MAIAAGWGICSHAKEDEKLVGVLIS